LRTIEGVRNVSSVGAGTFDIECGYGLDCRSAVANLAVEKGWELLELQAVDSGLEDVFLELSANSVTT